MSSDVPLSEVCVCGGTKWHQMIDRVMWCRRCGCVRQFMSRKWRVPLDRAGELPTADLVGADDEAKTDPGTPEAKKDDGEWV